MDSPDAMKAMVLCAGYGTRLGDLTREIPKPMLLLEGKPILAYILQHLRNHGCTEVAVNLHFKPELIQDYFGDGSKWGLRIHYSYEEKLLGTAGALRNFQRFLESESRFLVQYGDIITDQNLTEILDFHQQNNATATLLLHQRHNSNSAVTLDAKSRIIGFLERPSDEARRKVETPWVNSGLAVLTPEVLQLIRLGIPSDLPRDIYPLLIPSGGLYGFRLNGYRCAIDGPERLERARADFAAGKCRIQF